MTNDSRLFKTKDELEELGFELDGNQYVKAEKVFLPLYEAKMFGQFNHRFGTFESISSRINTQLPTPSQDKYLDLGYTVIPWYWISSEDVDKQIPANTKWIIVFRDVARATDERTGIFTILPKAAIANNAPCILFNNKNSVHLICLLSNVNAMPVDFITRQKVGGIHLNFFIVEQFPIIPIELYDFNSIDKIVPSAIELIYTAWDLKPFAEDILKEIGPEKWNEWFPENPLVDGVPQPFRWDEERRLQLRCELDAVYAHLYGISKDDLDYILGTFPIAKRKDEAKYGTYRTRDLILEYYEKYQQEGGFGTGESKL